jgi:AraC-like DNA-binding protein
MSDAPGFAASRPAKKTIPTPNSKRVIPLLRPGIDERSPAPKRLARTYRFTATVLAIDPAGPVDWLELAARAGYYDQAHFGHDFRAFTGLTPTRYLDLRRRFLREHPGHVLDVAPLPAD